LAFASDAFANVRALIALINDPKGCAAGLQSLQEGQAAASAAEAKLVAGRAHFAAEMETQRAEIAKERAASEKEGGQVAGTLD
jgi:hypothetical protein